MFDRIESGTQCRFDAGFLVRMGRYLAAQRVRGIGDHAQFLVSKLLTGSGCCLTQDAARCGDLDDVSTPFYLPANSGATTVGAVTNARGLHYIENLLAESMHIPMPAGWRDGFSGNNDLGSGNLAGLDGVAQGENCGAARAKVPYGRKTSEQSATGVHLSGQCGVGIGLRHGICLAIAACLTRKMHMQINEARHDEAVGKIDDTNLAVAVDVRRAGVTVANLHDFAVLNDNTLLF